MASAVTGWPWCTTVARTTSGMFSGPRHSAVQTIRSSPRSWSAAIVTGSAFTPRMCAGTTSSTRTGPARSAARLTVTPSTAGLADETESEPRARSSDSLPGPTTATSCSFWFTELKLTTCSLPPWSFTVATPITHTRQVRPVSIQGGNCTV